MSVTTYICYKHAQLYPIVYEPDHLIVCSESACISKGEKMKGPMFFKQVCDPNEFRFHDLQYDLRRWKQWREVEESEEDYQVFTMNPIGPKHPCGLYDYKLEAQTVRKYMGDVINDNKEEFEAGRVVISKVDVKKRKRRAKATSQSSYQAKRSKRKKKRNDEDGVPRDFYEFPFEKCNKNM